MCFKENRRGERGGKVYSVQKKSEQTHKKLEGLSFFWRVRNWDPVFSMVHIEPGLFGRDCFGVCFRYTRIIVRNVLGKF